MVLLCLKTDRPARAVTVPVVIRSVAALPAAAVRLPPAAARCRGSAGRRRGGLIRVGLTRCSLADGVAKIPGVLHGEPTSRQRAGIVRLGIAPRVCRPSRAIHGAAGTGSTGRRKSLGLGRVTSDAIAGVVLLSRVVEVRRRVVALPAVTEVVVTIVATVRVQLLGEVMGHVLTRGEQVGVPASRPWDEPVRGAVRMVVAATSRGPLDTGARLTEYRARRRRRVQLIRVATA